MKNLRICIAVATALVTGSMSTPVMKAVAAPAAKAKVATHHKHKAKKSSPKPKPQAAVICPMCKDKLSTRRDAAHPAAVKVNGKTYYCCKGCARH